MFSDLGLLMTVEMAMLILDFFPHGLASSGVNLACRADPGTKLRQASPWDRIHGHSQIGK